MNFLNRVRLNVATVGTGTITLGSVYQANCMTMAQAGAVDGKTYPYVIVEGNDFEIGTGTYTASGTTMTRNVRRSFIGGTSSTSTKMTLAGNAVFAIDAAAEDFNDFASLSGANIFTNTTEATGVGTTAAALFAGGVEISKKLFVTGAVSLASTLSVSALTASTSSTTGALVVGGGGAFGGSVNVGGCFGTSRRSDSGAQLDCSSASAFSVASGSSAVIALGSGYFELSIYEVAVTGASSKWILANGNAWWCGGQVTIWDHPGNSGTAGTTTPTSGTYSVAYDGSNYRIYNNTGSACSFRTVLLKP